MLGQKYGVVYTPDNLSVFVAALLSRFTGELNITTVLDPASGECSLLKAAKNTFGENCNYIGIDVDKEAVDDTKNTFNVIYNDFILPISLTGKASDYWKKKLPSVELIIANPPWSSEKIYDRSSLENAGYKLVSGQYDSYVLFIEQTYNILCDNGIMAFIVPDSIFDAQNEKLRKLLAEQTQIKAIARLGEKIFDGINRATTVIVCQKSLPNYMSETICFRLSTNERREYLSGTKTLMYFFDRNCHSVKQHRFTENQCFNFNIDARTEEEDLLRKITSDIFKWDDVFYFGRGVEISKKGSIVYCPFCQSAQGYKKQQLIDGKKECTHCGQEFCIKPTDVSSVVDRVSKNSNQVRFYVGESIHRYCLDGTFCIKPNIKGINYKSSDIYSPPKLLIRKTGLGIYGTIDRSNSLVSQTVYVLKYIINDEIVPMEYYLALLNSRVVYYYYLKLYGENEWKSHPYLTKKIIFSLPIRPYEGNELDQRIISMAKSLLQSYDYRTDLQLENLILTKYRLNDTDKMIIAQEMSRLPDLSAVENMKWDQFRHV